MKHREQLINLKIKKLFDTKWVFSFKENEKDNPKHKERLAAKGFAQHKELYYDETYSPVAKIKASRALLAVGVQNLFHFKQLDIKTAYLNEKIKSEVYIHPPKGVLVSENKVLKESSKCWYDEY